MWNVSNLPVSYFSKHIKFIESLQVEKLNHSSFSMVKLVVFHCLNSFLAIFALANNCQVL